MQSSESTATNHKKSIKEGGILHSSDSKLDRFDDLGARCLVGAEGERKRWRRCNTLINSYYA